MFLIGTGAAIRIPVPIRFMNIFCSSPWHRSVSRVLATGACLIPAVLSAHPGHYHPDENDEFDFLRTTFFHSHGALDYFIGAVVVASLAIFCVSEKPGYRMSALVTAFGSLVLLSII